MFGSPVGGKVSQQVDCFERLEAQSGDRPLPSPSFQRDASAPNQFPDADVLALRKVKKYGRGDRPLSG